MLGTVLLLSAMCGASPYPPSTAADGIELDWSTHRRSAQGSDNFQLTWADDGHLYGAWGDGGGFGGTNRLGRVGLGVARVEGSSSNYRGFNVWGGHKPTRPASFKGKSWGMICIDGQLHMWVVPDVPTGKGYRNHYEYIELASSPDHGRTWQKAPWRFVEAEQVTIPTFLNFGSNNRGVPARFGDYVYTYFIRPRATDMEQQGPHGVGLVVHRPGALFLARVPTREVAASKQGYQFFSGLDRQGEPVWSDLSGKKPVFEDPQGVGWCLSASYNPHLGRVVLTTEHAESGRSLLGIFDAPAPWGPWTTIEYFEEDAPFGAQRRGSDLSWQSNVFFAAFATKWLDGDRFTMNFTGAGRGKDNDSFNTVQGRFLAPQ